MPKKRKKSRGPNHKTQEKARCKFEHAIRNGDLESVKVLCETFSLQQLENRSHRHNSSFYFACASGNMEIIKYLISKQCTIDRTGFQIACNHGNFELIKFLISSKLFQGHEISSRSSKNALMVACENNDLSYVKFLIGRGCDVNEIPNLYGSGYNAFLSACKSGSLAVVTYLISLPNCDANVKTQNEANDFMLSCSSGNLNLVKYLKSLPNFNINELDRLGDTALIYACNNQIKIFEYLLSLNIDESIKKCFVISCKNGYIEMVKHLASMINSFDLHNWGGEILKTDHIRYNLRYIREHESEDSLQQAEKKVEVVIFLIEMGVEITEETQTYFSNRMSQSARNQIKTQISELQKRKEIILQIWPDTEILVIDIISEFTFGLKNLKKIYKYL